jgi:riboflavin transporter FmnP
MENGMETRHKRLIVISLFVAIGLFLPFLTFLLTPLKFDKSSFHISDLLWYISCYASTFVITQFLLFGGVGWLVSKLIYPKYKD